MTRPLQYVALYQKGDDLVEVLGDEHEAVKDLEERGYKLVYCVGTNNKLVYLKAKVKASLIMKDHTVKYYEEFLKKTPMTPEVFEETKRLQDEYLETLDRITKARQNRVRFELEYRMI